MGNPGFSLTSSPFVVALLSSKEMFNTSLSGFVSGRSQKENPAALPSRLQWQSITITLVEKVQIIAVFLGSLFLVASISWLLWSAFSPQAVWQRRDVLFQICYGMYGFMDLVCIGKPCHPHANPAVKSRALSFKQL